MRDGRPGATRERGGIFTLLAVALVVVLACIETDWAFKRALEARWLARTSRWKRVRDATPMGPASARSLSCGDPAHPARSVYAPSRRPVHARLAFDRGADGNVVHRSIRFEAPVG